MMMDLNDVSNIDVQIAIEEEAVCMAQEKMHENDERYHRAILKSLNDLKAYKNALYMSCEVLCQERCKLCEFHTDCEKCGDPDAFVYQYLQKAREQE